MSVTHAAAAAAGTQQQQQQPRRRQPRQLVAAGAARRPRLPTRATARLAAAVGELAVLPSQAPFRQLPIRQRRQWRSTDRARATCSKAVAAAAVTALRSSRLNSSSTGDAAAAEGVEGCLVQLPGNHGCPRDVLIQQQQQHRRRSSSKGALWRPELRVVPRTWQWFVCVFRSSLAPSPPRGPSAAAAREHSAAHHPTLFLSLAPPCFCSICTDSDIWARWAQGRQAVCCRQRGTRPAPRPLPASTLSSAIIQVPGRLFACCRVCFDRLTCFPPFDPVSCVCMCVCAPPALC